MFARFLPSFKKKNTFFFQLDDWSWNQDAPKIAFFCMNLGPPSRVSPVKQDRQILKKQIARFVFLVVRLDRLPRFMR